MVYRGQEMGIKEPKKAMMRLSNLKNLFWLGAILLSLACVPTAPTGSTPLPAVEATPIDPTPTQAIIEEAYVILHQDGTSYQYAGHLPEVTHILEAVEHLLTTADATYRLIITEDVIEEVRGGEALEVVYSEVQESVISFNQQPILYVRVLIPLAGRFQEGTVLINGAYARELTTEEPDMAALSGSWEVVVHSEGIGRLADLVEQLPGVGE